MQNCFATRFPFEKEHAVKNIVNRTTGPVRLRVHQMFWKVPHNLSEVVVAEVT